MGWDPGLPRELLLNLSLLETNEHEPTEVVADLQGSDPSDVLLIRASEVRVFGYFKPFARLLACAPLAETSLNISSFLAEHYCTIV